MRFQIAASAIANVAFAGIAEDLERACNENPMLCMAAAEVSSEENFTFTMVEPIRDSEA